jgi:hypothetical protein
MEMPLSRVLVMSSHIMRRWWRGVQTWLCDPDTSLAIIPLSSDFTEAVRRTRKAVRDVRDRAARQTPVWQQVSMGGLAGSGRLVMLVQHVGIDRDTLWRVLERRWPGVLVTQVNQIDPCSTLTVQEAVSLAVRRRGVEPLRAIVPAQQIALSTEKYDPMPMTF